MSYFWIYTSGLFGRHIALGPPSPRCASAIQIVRPFSLLQLLACPRQAQPVKVSDREPELGYVGPTYYLITARARIMRYMRESGY
jgi:hypothetical protein